MKLHVTKLSATSLTVVCTLQFSVKWD